MGLRRVVGHLGFQRAAIIFGLWGVAVTQPVLDLFGSAPEFFVAGRHTGSHVVWFAFLVALVPPMAASVVVIAGQWLHPRLGAFLFTGAVAGLAFLFGLVLASAAGLEGLWTSLGAGLAMASVVAWGQAVSEPVRTLLGYLALGNLVFVGMFLFASPVAALVSPRSGPDPGEMAWVEAPPLRGPVVVLILDELPAATLMTAEGAVNGERYPNFARLAEGATWFRNASSHSPMTHHAVPSLLAGLEPERGALPTFDDYPHTFFTMFGDEYPVHGYESVTHLCPDDLCGGPGRGSMATALKDSVAVYGHRVLPADLRDRLPAVDHTWGNFGSHQEAGADPAISADDPYGRWHAMDLSDTSARTQIRILDGMIAEIDDTPALHLAHVAVPHYPWVLTPDGELTQTLMLDRDPPDPVHEMIVEQAYQLQSLQIGAVDRSVGALMDRLEEVGAWDDALVVVTSDHGRGLRPPPDFGRAPTAANREELLRVPLFVKAPGQSEGEVRDDPAQLLDVMPSILDLFDARIEGDLDGRSLFDGGPPGVEPVVSSDVDAVLRIARRHARTFPHGDGWVGLAAVGEHGDLVGTSVDEHEIADVSGLTLTFTDEDLFGDLPAQGNRWPQLLLASVYGTGNDRPPDVLVAVNGTLAGVLSPYERDGRRWTFTGVTAPLFRAGANEVVAYEVASRDDAGRAVLRPLSHR